MHERPLALSDSAESSTTANGQTLLLDSCTLQVCFGHLSMSTSPREVPVLPAQERGVTKVCNDDDGDDADRESSKMPCVNGGEFGLVNV